MHLYTTCNKMVEINNKSKELKKFEFETLIDAGNKILELNQDERYVGRNLKILEK